MTAFFRCPDRDAPSGGLRQLYRHVDLLREAGLPAVVLHGKPGFRCTWFAHDTPVTSVAETRPGPDDHLVLPEIYGARIASMAPWVPKVVYNLSGGLTFAGHRLQDRATPYLHPEVVAAVVPSENTADYLRYAFPALRVHRVRPGVDPSLFRPGRKLRQIAVMPRRHREDLDQVLHLLKFRGVDAPVVVLEGRPPEEVARVLGESLVFLAVSRQEGFGMPALEAMACGCVVVGWPALGGREFFLPDHCVPLAEPDPVACARAVEAVLADPSAEERGRRAAAFARSAYRPEFEREDVLAFWEPLLR